MPISIFNKRGNDFVISNIQLIRIEAIDIFMNEVKLKSIGFLCFI